MDLKALLGDAYKEGMTFEEIEAALKEVQPPEDPAGAAEISRLKTALSKANGEAAEYKKQLRGKQSEAEQRLRTPVGTASPGLTLRRRPRHQWSGNSEGEARRTGPHLRQSGQYVHVRDRAGT